MKGSDPNEVLGEFLGVGTEPDDFWQQVKTNLLAGKIRLVFVADKIPAELQRIVEFLNVQMNPAQVLAVEIKQYVGQSLKTLIPRVIGQTVKDKPPETERRQWDEASFLQEIQAKSGFDAAKSTQIIFDWVSKKNLQFSWGKGKHYGSFIPKIISYKGESRKLFTVWTDSFIYIYADEPPFNFEEKKSELLNRLNSIVGKAVSFNKSIWTIPLSALKDELAVEYFLEVIDWAVQEIQAT